MVFLVAATSAGCGPRPRRVAMPAAAGVTVHTVELRWSNVHIIQSRAGDAAVMVDSGSPSDRRRLSAALAELDLQMSDIRAVILTHSHADHAGLARRLQRAGAAIIAGAGDVKMAARGTNDPLDSQSLTGWLIKPLIDFAFKPFTPDVVVESRVELAAYGLPGAWVEAMPGHTPGSLVVHLPGEVAFVGDMVAGGWFGGTLFADDAGGHYYQDDTAANRRNIRTLLDRGVGRFLLGHGGPVDARSMRRAVAPSTIAVNALFASEHGRGLGVGLEIGTHDVFAVGVGTAVGIGFSAADTVLEDLSPGVALGYRRYGSGWFMGPSLGLNHKSRAAADDPLPPGWNISALLDIGHRWRLGGDYSLRFGVGAGVIWAEEGGFSPAAVFTLGLGRRLRGAEF